MATEYKRLEEYGLIGNLATCALVGRDGSIDWCCFPHLESPSVFAAILDSDQGGHFYVRPHSHDGGKQTYVGNTNVLQTTFQTAMGSVSITDFMPVKDHTDPLHQTLLRKVSCSGGSVELDIELKPRFDYARFVPALEPAGEGTVAQWEDHLLFLQSHVPLDLDGAVARGTFTVKEGKPQWFVLRYGDSEGETCLITAKGEEICYTVCNRTEGRLIASVGALFKGMIGTGLGEIDDHFLLERCRVPSIVSVATGVFVLLFTTLSASLGHLLRFVQTGGTVLSAVLSLLLFTTPGVLIGGQLGPWAATHFPGRAFDRAVHVLLLAAACLALVEVVV